MMVNSIIITCCAQNNSHRGLAAAKEIAQRFKIALLIVMCFVLFQFTFDSSILAVNAEALPYQTLTDIEGKAIIAPQTEGKTLLLFFNPYSSQSKKSLFYSQLLYKRYRKSGLTVIGISRDVLLKDELRQIAKRMGLTFPVVLDAKNKIHRSFEAADCCGATLFFCGSQLKHDFKVNLLPEQLRQLTEKELKGTIEYFFEEVKQTVFVKGQKTPSIPLFQSDKGNPLPITEILEKNRFTVITFFSSLCSMCRTGKRLGTLNQIEVEAKELDLKGQNIEIVLVFMNPLDKRDIDDYQNYFPMPYRIYFSRYIFSEDELYLTDESLKKDPFTVILDGSGKIIFVEITGTAERALYSAILKTFLETVNET